MYNHLTIDFRDRIDSNVKRKILECVCAQSRCHKTQSLQIIDLVNLLFRRIKTKMEKQNNHRASIFPSSRGRPAAENYITVDARRSVSSALRERWDRRKKNVFDDVMLVFIGQPRWFVYNITTANANIIMHKCAIGHENGTVKTRIVKKKKKNYLKKI